MQLQNRIKRAQGWSNQVPAKAKARSPKLEAQSQPPNCSFCAVKRDTNCNKTVFYSSTMDLRCCTTLNYICQGWIDQNTCLRLSCLYTGLYTTNQNKKGKIKNKLVRVYKKASSWLTGWMFDQNGDAALALAYAINCTENGKLQLAACSLQLATWSYGSIKSRQAGGNGAHSYNAAVKGVPCNKIAAF